jgi:UPF0755 protein
MSDQEITEAEIVTESATDSSLQSGSSIRNDGAKSPQEALQPETAPPPPPPPPKKKKQRDGILSSISGFLSFFLVLMVGVMFGYGELLRELHTPGPLATDKAVVIVSGTDGVEIVDQLVSEGVITSSLLFSLGMRMEGQSSKQLRAGEYMFKQNASLQDVIDTLANGRVILHNMTIPEGWTSEQAVDRLRENDALSGDVKDIPTEGSIFPDTYRFSKGTSREQVLRQMQEASKKVIAEVWSKRASDLPFKTPYELVTLASIVEKETAKADERARVAAVYINRLNKHMRLQSDPTIVYGIVGGKATLGHPILKSELEKLTPFNTYLVEGLPPGPIANPGRAALEAVANPSRTKELYFVADGTGGHVFAETLEQHAKNVSRWRQIEKDAKDRLAPDAVLPSNPPSPAGTPSPVKPAHQGRIYNGAFLIFAADIVDDESIRQARERLANTLRSHNGAGHIFGTLVPGYPLSGSVEESTGSFTLNQTNKIILDASEGTPLDPLLDKTFDLNSPKIIPKLH